MIGINLWNYIYPTGRDHRLDGICHSELQTWGGMFIFQIIQITYHTDWCVLVYSLRVASFPSVFIVSTWLD